MITTARKRLARTLARLMPYSGDVYPWQRQVRVSLGLDDETTPMLTLQAANGVDFATAMLPAEPGSREEGVVAVPLELLRDVVAASQGEAIEIDFDAASLVVRDESSRSRILGYDLAAIPPMPVEACEADALVVSGGRALCDALGAAAATAAREDGRYAISAVLVTAAGEIVSTDGRMLQHIKVPVRMPAGRQIEGAAIMLPAALASEVSRWESCHLHRGQSHVYAHCDTDDGVWIAGTTATDQVFPPWESVMPREPGEHSIEGDADAIAAALRSASAMTDDGNPGVRLRLAHGAASIEARSAQAGEATVAVPCVAHGDAEIGLNPTQAMRLLKASGAVAAGGVTIRFGAPNRPIVYERGDAWRAVQMPTAMG